jgi:hypothetical protein
MNWFPRLGWVDISEEEAFSIDLNINYQWEAWGLIWLDYCLFFKVRIKDDGEVKV